MSWPRNRNQAESERRRIASDVILHAAMRLAQGGQVQDRLSIDQRPHNGKLLGRKSLEPLKYKDERLLRGYDRGNLRDAADRLSEGSPFSRLEFERILNGKR